MCFAAVRQSVGNQRSISVRERVLVRGNLLNLLTVEEGLRREHPYRVGDIRDGYADDLRCVIMDLREVNLHARYIGM